MIRVYATSPERRHHRPADRAADLAESLTPVGSDRVVGLRGEFVGERFDPVAVDNNRAAWVERWKKLIAK